MSQLTSLRELYIRHLSSMWLRALSTASASWTRLKRLELEEWLHKSAPSSSDLALLSELCANCPLLTDVTLKDCGGGDETVKTVVAARPGLRALHVDHNCEGSFLLELPAGLRELTINSFKLRSEAVAELARFSELRSLSLERTFHLRSEHLKACLAGCVSLEQLTLINLRLSVGDSLPAAGLPALRHLRLELCKLTDTDMGHLVERLQGLESVHLSLYKGLTEDCLAHLGRLPALRVLKLWSDPLISSISDETLAKLSSAPLVELELGDHRGNFSVTP